MGRVLPCKCPRLWALLLILAVMGISIGIVVTAISTVRVSKVDVQYCSLFMKKSCGGNDTAFQVANR